MTWGQIWRARHAAKLHAQDLGLPIPGTGRKRHGGPCPEGRCNWCQPRIDWNRSSERAAVRREVARDLV